MSNKEKQCLRAMERYIGKGAENLIYAKNTNNAEQMEAALMDAADNFAGVIYLFGRLVLKINPTILKRTNDQKDNKKTKPKM